MKAKYILPVMAILWCILLPCVGLGDDFFEDFDDNEVPDWEWIGKTDGSKVENGEVYMETLNFGQRVLILSPISVKNFTATFDMKIITYADGSLVFRYQDPNNYYSLFQGSGKVRLKKLNTDIEIVDKAHTKDQYVTYQVIAEDDNIEVYIGDEEVMAVKDSSILEKGRIGFLINIGQRADVVYSAYFDNFRVESKERFMAIDAADTLSTTWGSIKIHF